ncbi:hypothetical protein BPUM_2743 [Bacillus pumilus SAFR-032]|uniref:Uncharacterized protein n=1 Tax=Bacillus pumilus (strain SAFR-032) TaxID=315750 RepID=A8FGN2_BACP2|nr:hypothetical protein BPUM_2743 [Bacillus pumilus SAFR-032]
MLLKLLVQIAGRKIEFDSVVIGSHQAIGIDGKVYVQ